MATVEAEVKTVKQFIEAIEQTKIFGAMRWIDAFRKGMPPAFWESYLKAPLTEEVVITIGNEISHYTTAHLGDVSRNGHDFLREIHRAADAAGVVTALSKVDQIIEPPPPPVKTKKS